MSMITVQVGQCGNQIGGQLFDTLMQDVSTKLSQTNLTAAKNQDYIDQVLDRYFVWDPQGEPGQLPKARAVMVDMEPKVLE
jgi:tubulin delta